MPIAPEYLHLVYPGPFPAFLYGRASRDPKKKGRSVGDQLGEGRGLCERYGWPIVDEFKDVNLSASRHARRKRDDFEEMLAGIEGGRCRIVVAWEASRYYRDLDAYVRLRNACTTAGVLLCYNGTVYDLSKREDRKATAQDALQAEDEGEGIRDRTLRTVRANAEAGGPHGPVLYGYKRRYDPDDGALLGQFPHPEQAPIVQEVFRRTAAGESGYAIFTDLNARGVPGPSGGLWDKHHISKMLRALGYIGRRLYQGRDFGPAAWDPIIDAETWAVVQQIVRDPSRLSSTNRQISHLLTGLAVCGPCQDAGRRSALRVQRNRSYLSYVCMPEPGQSGFCVAMGEGKLDAYVTEALVAWLASDASLAAFDSGEKDAEAAAARLRVERLQEQLDEARAAATRFRADGSPELSVASLAAMEAALTPQIEAAQADVETVVVPPLLRGVAGRPDAEEVWEALTLDQKRLVLRSVVMVRLNRARVPGVRRIEPGRIGLTFAGQPGFRPWVAYSRQRSTVSKGRA